MWSRVGRYGRPHRRAFVAIGACGIGATVIMLSYPLIYGSLVNEIVAGHGIPAAGLVLAGLAALTTLHIGLRLVQARVQARTTKRITVDLEAELFDRLQRQPV